MSEQPPTPPESHLRVILILIVLAYVVFGVLYATRTPRWEAPDEPAHFNYVRQLAETGTFPVLSPGDYDQAFLEKIKAEKFPPELPIDTLRYESHQPPLYYALATPIYRASQAVGLDTVLALRLFSVALGALLLLLAYQVLRVLFQESQWLALAGAGLIATVPMHIAMTSAINNDTLAEVVLAALLLVSLRRAQGQWSDRQFILIGGIGYALALLTKTTIYVSGAAVLILGQLAYVSSPRAPSTTRRSSLIARYSLPFLFALALVISGAWFLRNASVYGIRDPFGWARHDAIVTGQPTTTEWIARYGFKNIFADFFIITFKSFWAQFGWMGVLVNDRIYVALFLLTALASLGAVLWAIRLVRSRAKLPAPAWWGWLMLGAVLALTLAAHAWYNLKFVQPQGRYLFPALISLAAFWTAGLYEVFEKRYARMLFMLLYPVMLGLDYVSLFWFIVPQLTRG